MKPFFTLAFVTILAACGADGAPEAPASQSSAKTGVTISGCATAGIVVGGATTGDAASC